MTGDASHPDTGAEGPFQARPGTTPSAPSASNYAVELPYAEELQAMLEGKYIVESFLGQGGMGAVYKGLQMPLKRPVAIKILAKRQEGAAEDEFAFEERFKREAYAMAALTHPNIVQVYDCGDAGANWLFISMELVEGGDLSDAIKAKLVTPEVALAMIGPICDGLQAAHDRGLVHRDIKPANIFLTADGKPKVADFGLAKKFDVKSTFVTKTGLGMGTPDYAAPEQYEGLSDLDHRADIYALGVMFYQMLTGNLPRGAYKPPSRKVPVDPRLDAVVSKAMQSDRAQRYQSTSELKADVDQIIATWMQGASQEPAAVAENRTGAIPTRTGTVPTHTAKVPTGPRRSQAPFRSGPVPTQPHAGGSAVHSPAPKKPGVGMVLGALGAVVLAVGALLLMRKPAGPESEPAPIAHVAPVRSEPSESSASPPAADASPRMTAPAPPVVAAPLPGEVAWVDGLKAWMEWRKSRPPAGSLNLNADGSVWMPAYGGLKHGPDTLLPPRNVAVRIRGRLGDSKDAFLRISLRQQRVGPLQDNVQYDAKLQRQPRKLTWTFAVSNKLYSKIANWDVPPDFDPDASHTLECRAVGDVLTMALDGKDVGSVRDSQLREGHFSVGGRIATIEGFEYALLGGDAAAPDTLAAPVEFQGHRYQPVLATANWQHAARRAELMGAHLLTLNSAEEQQWVESTLLPKLARAGLQGEQRFALGAQRKSAADPWVWQTGESVGFTAWRQASGPDNSSDKDVVLEGVCRDGFTKMEWDDVPVGAPANRQFFIAEWEEGAGLPPAPGPPLSGTVDLLAKIDVERDAIQGTWKQAPEGLVLELTQGPQVLEIPVTPPEEYDFEIEYSVREGSMEAAQMVPMHSETLLWKLGCGGGYYTFGPHLDGQKSRRAEASVKRARLLPNERHRSLLQVRKGSVRAEFDGEEVLNWKGDLTRFTGEVGFGLKDASRLGLASWNTAAIFYKAELRPPGAPGGAPLAGAPMPQAAPSTSAGSAPATDSGRNAERTASDPRLAQLESGFKARYSRDVEKPFQDGVAALNKSYLANGVARARATAQAKGSLKEVTAFDEVKARIERGEGVPAEDPPGTPESLKALRSLYRTALAKLEGERDAKAAPLYDIYLQSLDAYAAELARASKLPEVEAVKAVRAEVASRRPVPRNEPLPTVAQASPPPSPMSPDSAPKPAATGGGSSWRNAAMYLATNGGVCVVNKGTGDIRVEKLEDIPAGRFDILEVTIDRFNSSLPLPTAEELAVLSGLRDVRSVMIRLPQGTLPDSAFSWIAGNDGLRWINFESAGDITDGVMAYFSSAKKLELLSVINAPKFTGKTLAKAPFEHSLVEVRIVNTGFSDEGLKALASFRELRRLQVSGSKVTGAGCAAALGEMKALESLVINDCDFGDDSAAIVATLKNLTGLNLNNTRLTDKGLEALKKMKGLTSISLTGSDVTADGAAAFQKARSDCKVTY